MNAELPNLFPALDSATEAALRESIQRFGVLVPVVRDQHGRTLDGNHRSRVADELGVQYRVDVVKVDSDKEADEIAVTLNTDRRQLTTEQRREVVAVLRERGHSERAIAGAVGASPATVHRDLSGASHEAPDEVVGQDGKRYPAKRSTVVAAPNESQAEKAQTALQELGDDVDFDEGVVAVNTVTRAAKRKKQESQIPSAVDPPREALAGEVFDVVYVDPPWRYEHAHPNRAIENHYPTMSHDELCALDVPAGDSAVLFMWATSPKLAEAISLIDTWDFTYKTCAVWVKDRIGMGYYFRQRHELLLVATRGKPAVPDETARADSVIEAPRGEHSAKPHVVYELLEGMYPASSRVELFARNQRPGWSAWGNQA